jgi:hypothetical protein
MIEQLLGNLSAYNYTVGSINPIDVTLQSLFPGNHLPTTISDITTYNTNKLETLSSLLVAHDSAQSLRPKNMLLSVSEDMANRHPPPNASPPCLFVLQQA